MPEENKERLRDRCNKTVCYLTRSYKLKKDVGEVFPVLVILSESLRCLSLQRWWWHLLRKL